MLLRDLSWRSSIAPHNLYVRLAELPLQQQLVRCATHRFSFRRELAKNSRVGTRIRARRGVKSNEEVCDELREFVLMVGLPKGHVPSWKELAENGRKDLANIVRRRGYKLITELLTSSTKEENITDMSLAENHEATDSCKDESVVVEGKDQNGDEAPECSTSENSDVESYSSGSNGGAHLLPVAKSESLGFSVHSSLQEKAAKFVQDGELEIPEGEGDSSFIGYGISNGRNTEEPDLDKVAESGASRVELLNFEATSDNAILVMNDKEELEDNSTAEVNDGDHQVEIRRLKDMLHQKELELTRLKEQIEKEKLALSALQTKAEHEIGKAREIISAKDEELLAVEESLSGLKEVQIEYWGNAETVEIAGSFNGWHDRVKLDTHPASSSLDLTGSRKSGLWSVVLWLYPGIYEIKFIVDGHWQIDPQRESVSRGTIQNNILRVDR
ncbi:hypothetical protein Scep_015478 [Stephania cephalantha]|uniref:AMP-activated protein kinase glycogen-binding domain-containing protein n=1 Tax=Stephania cephalantha TaxID=152367 RepID=A0AAP0J5E8_9MAGN